jgi:hypothetical protein
MGANVFANGNEIACQASDCKVVAAFPDVCMTPPSPPAGPIPVPYPDSSFARDMKNGSKAVKIGGKPVMLKDQSFYSTSPLGNEAATRSFGAGVVSHQITGKTYFAAWSMDVKAEGQNLPRHLDLTTSNHGSPPNEAVPTPTLGTMAAAEKDDEPKCDCCGKPAHSANQAGGKALTEEEFYSPKPAGPPPGFAVGAMALLKEIRSGPCKNLLPPGRPKKTTKCNKYYVTTEDEKRAIDGRWDGYRDKYYRKFKVPKGTAIGHRVPRAAGGCPTGPGNLTPQKPECKDAEDRLSRLQERAIRWHRTH